MLVSEEMGVEPRMLPSSALEEILAPVRREESLLAAGWIVQAEAMEESQQVAEKMVQAVER